LLQGNRGFLLLDREKHGPADIAARQGTFVIQAPPVVVRRLGRPPRRRARPGDTVEVLSDDLKLLGRAAYSPRSQIRARFWTFDGEESVDAFFKRRIAAAVARRQACPS
jgi:23S rRNA G2069 N7-methylase RlmK/C1962 C5-methylase RlmI